MENTLLVIWLAILFCCIITITMALLRIQRRHSERLQVQMRAWERAQEVRQQAGKERQDRQIARLEQMMIAHLEQQQATPTLATEPTSAAEPLAILQPEQSPIEIEQVRIERELAQLPHVEDMPLPGKVQTAITVRGKLWQAAKLSSTDLSERNLTYRYLGQADLRNAQLAQANLFMADLSGADLSGANLAGADLAAANLAWSNLAGANLSATNLLVCDLNHANLVGANLHNARNLTTDQLKSAITDNTTQLDGSLDLTLPYRTPQKTTTI